jgi:cyanophycinase
MTPRRGTLALVGAGEFLDSMASVDAALLERAGGGRVVVLPTASAPDGAGVPERWAEQGMRHFARLGAHAEAVMAIDRVTCAVPRNVDAVRAANLVYVSGGKPDYLLGTLTDTPVWEGVLSMLQNGGVLAGCSAGAMVLGGWIPARPTGGSLSIWRAAFGLIPGSVIMPHFDEIPRWITAALGWVRPRRSLLIGLDGGTALVGPASGGGAWEVLGAGRVVLRGARLTGEYRKRGTVPLRV